MTNGVDRELGETDARLASVEARLVVLERQNAEMIKALYMGRGVGLAGAGIAAITGVIWTIMQIAGFFQGRS